MQAASDLMLSYGEMHLAFGWNRSPPSLFLEGMAWGLWCQEAAREAAQPRSPALVGDAVPGSLANVLALASKSRGFGQQLPPPLPIGVCLRVGVFLAPTEDVPSGDALSQLSLGVQRSALLPTPPWAAPVSYPERPGPGPAQTPSPAGKPRASAPPAVRGWGSCSDPTDGLLARAVALLDGGARGWPAVSPHCVPSALPELHSAEQKLHKCKRRERRGDEVVLSRGSGLAGVRVTGTPLGTLFAPSENQLALGEGSPQMPRHLGHRK